VGTYPSAFYDEIASLILAIKITALTNEGKEAKWVANPII